MIGAGGGTKFGHFFCRGCLGVGLWEEGVVRGRPKVSTEEEVVVWPKLGQSSWWDEASET